MELIYNGLTFMKKETTEGLLIPLEKAAGVSVSNVPRIKEEGRRIDGGYSTLFQMPDKKRKCRRNIVSLDEFNEALVQRTMATWT
jgi:hypothetical protein